MGGVVLAIFASLGAAVTTWACTTKRFSRGHGGGSDGGSGDHRDEAEEKNESDRKAEKGKKKEEQAADDDRLPPRHSNSEAHSVQQPHDERSTADASASRSIAEVQEGDDELRAWRPQLPPHLKTVKRIGSGAYGEVFLCEDESTKSQVAVKVIREFAKEPLRGKRILREIRLLASLQHANLLSTTDILAVPNPDFDDIYIVTPYMHVDLHRLIHSKVPLVESHSRAFVCQILRGLKYLHSAGVMHRDLKPSNVLVNKDCSLKIADFGLARGKSGEEESEELTDYVVTRWYRAPELILLPAGYFEAVDLWSVGCIMMELLTREPLFPGKDHLDMLRRIASVLGFSAERDLGWVPPKDQKVVLQTLRTQRLPEHPEKPLQNRLQRLDDGAEPAAKAAREACLDLVTKLLDKVPLTRISAAQALAHPYLAHLQNPAAETEAPELFDWNFDRFEATRRALKDRVYAECARYHPEIVERDAEWIRTRGFNLTSGRSITAPLDPNSLGSVPLGPFAK